MREGDPHSLQLSWRGCHWVGSGLTSTGRDSKGEGDLGGRNRLRDLVSLATEACEKGLGFGCPRRTDGAWTEVRGGVGPSPRILRDVAAARGAVRPLSSPMESSAAERGNSQWSGPAAEPAVEKQVVTTA